MKTGSNNHSIDELNYYHVKTKDKNHRMFANSCSELISIECGIATVVVRLDIEKMLRNRTVLQRAKSFMEEWKWTFESLEVAGIVGYIVHVYGTKSTWGGIINPESSKEELDELVAKMKSAEADMKGGFLSTYREFLN